MNLLSDEQRQELKTLPAWFLSRLKEEVAAKKDADQALEAEQQRLEKFNQLVADWQKDQEAQKASTFGALQERLDTTLAEVQRWADEEKKKQGSVYRVLDDQYEAKKQELADTEKKMNARKDQITLLKKEIEHLGDLTREKKAKSMFGLSDKKPRTVSMNPRRGSAVRKRLNSLAIGQLPAGVVPPVQVEPALPQPAQEPEPEMGPDETPVNTVETSDPIHKIDLDSVPLWVYCDSLLDLLLEPQFSLLKTIVETVTAAEQDKLSKPLVTIFDTEGRVLDLLDFVIRLEVTKTFELATLFRSNSLASRIMSAYARNIGIDYLQNTIKDLIDNVIRADENLEIDPMKFYDERGGTVSVPKELIIRNQQRILALTQEFLARILQTFASLPLEFHQIARLLRDHVSGKFPEGWKIAIGGFIFLRIFCPLIYRPPDEFGYDFAAIPNNAKRTLVLIAKIIQNLANYMPKFGEESMGCFSDFVAVNIPQVDRYFTALAEIPPNKQPSPENEISATESLKELIRVLVPLQQRMNPGLATETRVFVQKWSFSKGPKLLAIMNRLGAPIDSIRYNQSDMAVDEFASILTNDDGIVIKGLLEVIDAVQMNQQDEDYIADHLMLLFESRARGGQLITSALQSFSILGLRRGKSVHESIGARIFPRWARTLLREKLREPFIPLLDVLRKALPDIMRRDVLAQVSAVFVFAIARAILTLPVPVWKVCDSVMKNPNLGEQTVLHLLLHCMFCIVLDDPEGFGLVSGSEQDRQLRKGLLMISDMVKLLVVAKEDKSNTDMNKFIVESGATIRAVVSQWLSNFDPTIGPFAFPVAWETYERALFVTHKFVFSHMSRLHLSLESNALLLKWVSFTLQDGVSTLLRAPIS